MIVLGYSRLLWLHEAVEQFRRKGYRISFDWQETDALRHLNLNRFEGITLQFG